MNYFIILIKVLICNTFHLLHKDTFQNNFAQRNLRVSTNYKFNAVVVNVSIPSETTLLIIRLYSSHIKAINT